MKEGTTVLGSRYRDRSTGFEGMASGRLDYLGSRRLIEITRALDGRRIEEWVPELFLEPVLEARPRNTEPPTEAPPPTATLPGERDAEPVSAATPPTPAAPGGEPVSA